MNNLGNIIPCIDAYTLPKIYEIYQKRLMEVKKINTDKLLNINHTNRPNDFDEFVGQEHIKGIVKTAIDSGKKRK
jgi:hypothetical protein